MIFATINAAGADITEAARRCPAISGMLFSHVTYSAITLPATVENPPTITVINSEFVILEIYGLIRMGASVCPTKMFAEILKVSAPLVFIVFSMTLAIFFIII